MRLTEHVASTKEIRNEYRISVGSSEGKETGIDERIILIQISKK
jgi:hypothetical protein